MTIFKISRFYKSITAAKKCVRECKAIMPNNSVVLYSESLFPTTIVLEGSAKGFWEEVKIPRKVRTMYAAILEDYSDDKKIYIGNALCHSKEHLKTYYSNRKIVDIIEINYEEKL